MRTSPRIAAALLSSALVLAAQTPVPRRSIRATGVGTVSIAPDQAKLAVGVITRAPRAQDAATQNATKADQMIKALKTALGPNAEVRTISYSISPNYTYPNNQPPVLNGYVATNVVQAVTYDLTAVGKVLDTVVQSGGNEVQGLTFGLRDERPARAQALQQASRAAQAQVAAIAEGLGVKTGKILSAEESGSSGGPVPMERPMMMAAARVATPVEPGNLTITATVSLEVEIQP